MSPDSHAFYRWLGELDALDLPSTLKVAGVEDGRVEVQVATTEVELAQAYFTEHPFDLSDGTRLPVEVAGLAGSWSFEPADTWDGTPGDLSPSRLAGLEMSTAAAVATELGWRVRAYEPEAPLTADLVDGRLNLCCSPDGTVVDVHVG